MSENEIEEMIKVGKEMIKNKKNIDDVLGFIRLKTGSKVISMMVIADVLNISKGEAKLLVHKSNVWADVMSRDEKFHEEVISEVEKPEKTE